MKNFGILFIKIYYLLRKIGIPMRGLGKIQRLLKTEFIFKANEKKYWYNPSIEGSYDYLLIEKSNEPETHLFLQRVLQPLNEANFIDVGASVGEFVFGISNYPHVKQIFAFEPRPDCAMVLRKNMELNEETRIRVFENAVSNSNDFITLHLNSGGTSSGIYGMGANVKHSTIKVKTVTLDSILPETLENTIILVDIEGAEPLALEGGKSFIRKNKPLIIFEHNLTSKKYFNLNDIQKILGDNYSIYRIKNDGNLDQDFSNSWNCVGIPANTAFEKILINR